MKLTEKINLFVEPKPFKKNGEEKIFYKLSTSIATKQKDESYKRMVVDVLANDKKYPDAVLAKLDPNFMYTVNIINGWLIVTDYVNKEGRTVKKLAIYVEEMKITGKTAIDQEKRNKALLASKGDSDGENNDFPF